MKEPTIRWRLASPFCKLACTIFNHLVRWLYKGIFFCPFGKSRPFEYMTWKRAYRKAMIDRTLQVGREPDVVPADLLIPAQLLHYAMNLKRSMGEWRDLVVYLVCRHRARVLQLTERAGNLRFRYQDDGLDLRRICYVPYRDMIAELRMLSFASRISMCALIVLMLEWEQQGEGSPELDSFIGSTKKMESLWNKEDAILIISAAIQMSCASDPPSTA